jgi:hypothetical protein
MRTRLDQPVPGAPGAEYGIVGGPRHHSGGRPGDDDRRAVGQVEKRHGNGVHDAEQVDVGGVDEIGRIRLTHGHGEDAGVGHDHVEPVEVGDARL